MPTLHIFNPDHDEALAAGTPFYTPTRAARAMAQKGARWPHLWSEEGDYVLLPDAEVQEFSWKIAKDVFPKDLTPALWERVGRIDPWGWDAALCRRLRLRGAPERLLPEAQRLEAIRQLSSRATSVRLLRLLRQALPETVGEAEILTDIGAVEEFASHHAAVMLKAPWSCSGRGVFKAAAPLSEAVRRRVERILGKQGSIAAEPFYDRIRDFALEFEARPGGSISYQGLSHFACSSMGAYGGNLIAPQSVLLEKIGEPLPILLPQLIAACTAALQTLLQGKYCGPLGIDMMLVRKGGAVRLHPCVELNLRRTMGHVALFCTQKKLNNGTLLGDNEIFP
ncbi:MAG: hypothetical protein ACI3X6_01545 [Alloprevotella sp.]